MNSTIHPFLAWVASLKGAGMVRADGKDVVLSVPAGKEFALGLHDGEPLLCFQKDHEAALKSVSWSAAALLFNSNDSDWIILSCRDVRPRPSPASPAVPVRVFFPVTLGRLDSWKSRKPQKLHVGPMSFDEKGSPVSAGEPFVSLPLSLV